MSNGFYIFHFSLIPITFQVECSFYSPNRWEIFSEGLLIPFLIKFSLPIIKFLLYFCLFLLCVNLKLFFWILLFENRTRRTNEMKITVLFSPLTWLHNDLWIVVLLLLSFLWLFWINWLHSFGVDGAGAIFCGDNWENFLIENKIKLGNW